MTDENQKLMKEIVKTIVEQFGAKYTLNHCQDKYMQSKKIVIDYGQKKKNGL